MHRLAFQLRSAEEVDGRARAQHHETPRKGLKLRKWIEYWSDFLLLIVCSQDSGEAACLLPALAGVPSVIALKRGGWQGPRTA